MRAHTNITTIVHLDDDEKFKFETRTGPIMVDTIRFTPSSFETKMATARGGAIKADGSMGLVNRQDSIDFRDIPLVAIELAVQQMNERHVPFALYAESNREHPEIKKSAQH